MLVSMKAILEDANTNYYGVMAMNSINIEMARAGIMAAEEEHSPYHHPVWPRPDEESCPHGGNASGGGGTGKKGACTRCLKPGSRQ